MQTQELTPHQALAVALNRGELPAGVEMGPKLFGLSADGQQRLLTGILYIGGRAWFFEREETRVKPKPNESNFVPNSNSSRNGAETETVMPYTITGNRLLGDIMPLAHHIYMVLGLAGSTTMTRSRGDFIVETARARTEFGKAFDES